MYLNKFNKYQNKLLNLHTTQVGGINPVIGYHHNQGGRPYQEDRIDVLSGKIEELDYVILSIFDGHGGADTSDYLSKNLPARCKVGLDALKQPLTYSMIENVINTEFAKIDLEVTPEMRQQFTGSTAVICIVFENNIFVANIADSPAIVFDRAGNKKNQTNIHDCNNQSEIIRINTDGRRPLCEQNIYGAPRLNLGYLPSGNIDRGLDMTRAFGDNAYKPKADAKPELYVWARNAGDILCICSDSFFDMKLDRSAYKQNEDDIINEVLPVLITNNFDPQVSVTQIVEKRATTIRGDNTSMILAIL